MLTEYFKSENEALKTTTREKAEKMLNALKEAKAVPVRPVMKDGAKTWVECNVSANDYAIRNDAQDKYIGQVRIYGVKDALCYNLNEQGQTSSVRYNPDVYGEGRFAKITEETTLSKPLAKVLEVLPVEAEKVKAEKPRELSVDFKAYLVIKEMIRKDERKAENGKAEYYITDVENGKFAICDHQDFRAEIDMNNASVNYMHFNGKGNPPDKLSFLQIKDKGLRDYVGTYMDTVDKLEREEEKEASLEQEKEEDDLERE